MNRFYSGLKLSTFFVFILLSLPGAVSAFQSPSEKKSEDPSESKPSTSLVESMGFRAEQVQCGDRVVEFFVSTEGKPADHDRKLPVVIFLQGSGPTPLFFGAAPKLGSSLMYDANDFSGYHYVVISKPNVPFHSEARSVESPEYLQFTSLDHRVENVKVVVDYLLQQSWVDQRKMVLIGHSEGADVAPWAAVANPSVTHLVVLAPGAVSQMFEFTIMERKAAARGDKTEAEVRQSIADNLEAYRSIFADPKNWQKKWYGHSYLRWSTFLRPPMEAYVELKIPILAFAGRDDRNTPCESAEALQLEFIRRQKQNLTFEMLPVDHYFVEKKTDGSKVDHRLEIGTRINDWLNK